MNKNFDILNKGNFFELSSDKLVKIIEEYFNKDIPLIKEGRKKGWFFYDHIKESKKETISYLKERLYNLNKEEMGDLVDFQFLAKKNRIEYELSPFLYNKRGVITDLPQFDLEYLFFIKIAEDKGIEREYFRKEGETPEESFKRWLVDIGKKSLEMIKLSDSIKGLVYDYEFLFNETSNLISKIFHKEDHEQKIYYKEKFEQLFKKEGQQSYPLDPD